MVNQYFAQVKASKANLQALKNIASVGIGAAGF
jgi:hypothetical protein